MNTTTLRLLWVLFFLHFFVYPCELQAQSLDLAALTKNGSVRIENIDGTPVLRHRDDEHFIPASVLKIATAFCALEILGPEYRYETIFSYDSKGTLFVQGSGDPSLVSETLDSIASNLSQKITKVDRIVVDTSIFSDEIAIDGSERSLNPYDAKNAAFVANFSSAFVTHTRQGIVNSAEPQTPLTPRARSAGALLPRGKTERVNLSKTWKEGVLYSGELFSAFLRKHGIVGTMNVSLGQRAQNAPVLLRHRSPSDLGEIVRGMLKFSTNFTANQLFLTLGAHQYGIPATVPKAQEAMRVCMTDRVGWADVHIEEGSGLSRKTRVSAKQMTQLLSSFERYKSLLPEEDGFLAKTGSLRGVNSLAGYFTLDGQIAPLRFAILINAEVPHLYKYKVGREIRSFLNSQKTPK